MDANTASLRSSAPQWSLAGDKQLLDILQNIHQSLVSRCQEVNRKLDEMVLALDGASVDLQNVNNKFMALSNSQFIESRVYDDDVDIAAQEQPKEAPKPVEKPLQDLQSLKHSIRVLESTHEIIEILDSDSDESDDDEITRTVLKPKDMYGHRPLPYIIGSQPWRNKWHAGLHPDSDSDSSTSKPDMEQDQYSDSEPEPDVTRTQLHPRHDIEESTASSELPSEQGSNVGSLPAAGVRPSPSDVAAELARRLGGNPAKIPIIEPDYSPPTQTNTKVYRPDQPSVGTVFCDEPPPLDQYQSESEAPSEEDDIFAELHKSRPSDHGVKDQSRLAEDLFSGLADEGDIFSDFREDKVTSTPAKSTLFGDEPEPALFAPPQPGRPLEQDARVVKTDAVKKPVGGISLFGNNKGAESIGAAILKRHQRQSSSDSDVTPQTKEEAPPKIKESDNITTQMSDNTSKSKEKDIFDDLFAKSEREQKNKGKSKKEPPKETAKVDLFSDNIFDDIDDIFASNITTVKKDNKNDKPLFDDDDDLFSNIAVSKGSIVAAISSKEKSIFDSDDDLFSDKKQETIEPRDKAKDVTKINNDVSKTSKHVTKSNEFDDVDDIFSDVVEVKNESKSNVVNVVAEEITTNKVEIETNLAKNKVNEAAATHNDPAYKNVAKLSNTSEENRFQNRGSNNNNIEKSTKSLFDDEDDDELFAKESKKSASDENSNIVSKTANKYKNGENTAKADTKSSLFDDDSDENDLFGSSSTKQYSGNNLNFKESTDNSKKSVKSDVSDNNNKNTDLQRSSIFDDDVEADDIFASSSKSSITSNEINKTTNKLKESETIKVDNNNKSSLDNDDDIDDLFSKVAETPVVDSKLLVKDKNSLEQRIVPENEHKSIDAEHKPSISQKPSVNVDQTIINQQITSNIQKEAAVAASEENIPVKHNESTEMEKPVIEERKPALSKKPKPLITEKPDTKPVESVRDTKDDNLTTEEEIEPEIVDSEISKQTDDEVKETINTIPSEDELFTSKPDLDKKVDLKYEPIEYKIPDLDKIEPTTSFEEKDALFSTPKDTLLGTPVVFDDIFSEPPAFEKSSEPKKSKNVNALFDDDSDDEALFFKKNEPIIDEKPDVEVNTNRDALFGLFHDEPPAIEVDFTQKPSKSNLNDDFLNSDDEDLFTIKDKQETVGTSESSKKYLVSDDISKTNKIDENIPTSQSDSNFTTKAAPLQDKAEIFEQISKQEPKIQKDSTDSDNKKIGKLKTMNFNIDVSTLLPGASPKKKAVEQTDGQVSTKSSDNIHKITIPNIKQTDSTILSSKSHEDLQTKDKVEPSVLKSVSFDGEPDSNILDNKLSKGRAKIQVKRRPSTRRARKEAVRKSAIDIDDSTDNSSSLDDPPKFPRPNSRLKDTEPKIEPEKIETKDITSEPDKKEVKEIEYIPTTSDVSPKNLEKDAAKPEIQSEISEIVKESVDTTDSKQIDVTPSNAEQRQSQIIDEPEYKRPDTKNITKRVYILNDEDIFTNPTIETPQKSKVLNIVNDDDDLFKNTTKKTENITGISTLGNAYKDIASDIKKEVISAIESNAKLDVLSLSKDSTSSKSRKSDQSKVTKTTDSIKAHSTTKKSLFDDLSGDEDELFKAKKPTKTKSILDSDSEDDLFGGRKKETKDSQLASARETKDVKKVEVKSSLFGDEDDDDLFGVKVKSSVAVTPQPPRARETTPKPPELVFDDPLSLLGGDDD